MGILVIFWVLGVFWLFLGFRGILVIFWVFFGGGGILVIFGFKGILVIFGFQGYVGHFLGFKYIFVIF